MWHLYGFSPVWIRRWVLRLEDWLNVLSHMWHMYCLSSVWILMWRRNVSRSLNALSHTWHSNGFSPVWLRMCSARWWLVKQHLSHSVHMYLPRWIFICRPRECRDEKRLSHSSQEYSFSALWTLLCLMRLCDVLNRLLQTVHSNGFSPVWRRQCTAKARLFTKHLPHSVHLYLPEWIFICSVMVHWDENCFWQWTHSYTFRALCNMLCLVKFGFLINRLSHTVHKYGLDLSSCGCSVWSLLSASVFTSDELSPV